MKCNVGQDTTRNRSKPRDQVSLRYIGAARKYRPRPPRGPAKGKESGKIINGNSTGYQRENGGKVKTGGTTFAKGNKLAKGGKRPNAGRPTKEAAAVKKLAAEVMREYIEKRAEELVQKYVEIALEDPATLRHVIGTIRTAS